MTTLIGPAYWALTLALAPLFGFLALVTVAALAPRRQGGPDRGRVRDRPGGAPPRFMIVIPAFDEEANVGATVASCLAIDYEPDRFTVYVIADNCTDGTAAAAREAGALVVERTDPQRRSKGYALDDFFRGMTDKGELGRYDAAVVVDADTFAGPELLSAFAGPLSEGADWAQGYYTVLNPDASWRTRLSTYALGLFNGVWLLGQDRLGLGAGLRGNGMCLSTRGLARHPWRAYGLVEDLEFGWSLRVAGERVRFVPGARVAAEMVSRGRGAVTQRRRWEEGRRALKARFFRPLLATRALGPVRKFLSLLDLLFPPMTTLLCGFVVALTVHPLALGFPRLAPVSRQLLPWHALMPRATTAYAASPVLALGLPPRYLGSLAAAPYFAAWKFAVLFRSRTTAWVRTEREAHAGKGA